jgi:hypothetical protein
MPFGLVRERAAPAILLVASFLSSLPCGAILIRPDRDDAEYLELATRYPSSVPLNPPDGEGVLIAPRWVLTAAHVVKALQELKALPKLAFAGREYEIQSMVAHPEWKKGNPFDIGLLLLREPVTGVEPTPIRRDKDEDGLAGTIVGHGYTGKIGQKTTREGWDMKARAAINTVDRLGPRSLGLRIKGPEEASDLQGAAAPGDGGGPFFIEDEKGVRVAGIGYATDDTNDDGIFGNIGDWELYARVSAFADWIDEAMFKAAAEEASAPTRK